MWHTLNIQPKIGTYNSYWPCCEWTTGWAFTNFLEFSIALRVRIGVILIYFTRCSGRTCLTRNCNLILIDKAILYDTLHPGVRQITLLRCGLLHRSLQSFETICGLWVHGRGMGSGFVFCRLTVNCSLSHGTIVLNHLLMVCSLSFETASRGNTKWTGCKS